MEGLKSWSACEGDPGGEGLGVRCSFFVDCEVEEMREKALEEGSEVKEGVGSVVWVEEGGVLGGGEGGEGGERSRWGSGRGWLETGRPRSERRGGLGIW